MIPGIDTLGAAKYKQIALQFFRTIKTPVAFGGFAVEFGDLFPLSQQIAKIPIVPIQRIQLTWAGNSHIYTAKHLEIALKEAKRYNKLKTHQQIQLSPFCEHQLDNPDPWLERVQDAAPTCTIVNNPQEGKGNVSRLFMNEIHTGPPPHLGPYNFSYDGQSACDADIEADKQRYRDAQVFFLWTWQLNCHYNAKDKTRNTMPSVELMRGLLNLMGPRGACSLPPNVTWKSFAEQSDPKGDYRSNKPMCLYAPKVEKLTLVKNGKVIGTLPRYSTPFKDGRWRYYLGQWGYKVAREPVELRDGNKVIGMVNPGFRFGDYRD